MGSDVSKCVDNDHKIAAQKILDDGCFYGWEVRVAEEDELQLDFDTMDTPQQFLENYCILQATHGVVDIRHSISKSGNGRHIIIKLAHKMLLETRIAWQAVLGSDPKREALCLVSVAKSELNPVLLFEREKS